MTRSHTPVALSALVLSACVDPSAASEEAPPIACRLDGMSPVDRAREGILLREHHAAFVEVREGDDGYSYRYPADPAVFVRTAELITLEHRCCPFLRFELDWPGGDAEPWLHVIGGARAKVFIAEAFGRAPANGTAPL